jgi:hypothetical protein
MKPNLPKAEQFVRELRELFIKHRAKLDHGYIDVAGVSLDVSDGTILPKSVFFNVTDQKMNGVGAVSLCRGEWQSELS